MKLILFDFKMMRILNLLDHDLDNKTDKAHMINQREYLLVFCMCACTCMR